MVSCREKALKRGSGPTLELHGPRLGGVTAYMYDVGDRCLRTKALDAVHCSTTLDKGGMQAAHTSLASDC
jgi:hypothetical protein